MIAAGKLKDQVGCLLRGLAVCIHRMNQVNSKNGSIYTVAVVLS